MRRVLDLSVDDECIFEARRLLEEMRYSDRNRFHMSESISLMDKKYCVCLELLFCVCINSLFGRIFILSLFFYEKLVFGSYLAKNQFSGGSYIF